MDFISNVTNLRYYWHPESRLVSLYVEVDFNLTVDIRLFTSAAAEVEAQLISFGIPAAERKVAAVELALHQPKGLCRGANSHSIQIVGGDIDDTRRIALFSSSAVVHNIRERLPEAA